MIQFLSDEIWTTIRDLSKNSGRTRVAVAYFGTGASEQLTFKKGDTLIIAMHLNNVKAGQVNPFEIQKLYDKGVLIYTLSNLHSKIYLFDKKMIVCSANVSSHSADCLIESGILTDDKTTFENGDRFIKENSVEKVEQDYIELCKENYNPPKHFGKRKKNSDSTFNSQFSRLWFISTKSTYFEDEDYTFLKKDEHIFEKKLQNKRAFELNEIKYPITNRFINKVQEGDILIEVERHKVRGQVFQPIRALGVTFNKVKKTAFLRVEKRKKPIVKGWTVLEKYLRQHGITAITKNSTREIKNEKIKKILLNFFD